MNRTGRLAHRFAQRFALAPARVHTPAIALAVALLCPAAAFAQLSDAAKKAPNADTAAIQRHVDAAVKNLASDDPEKQAKGREDLAGGVVLADPAAQPSPVFLDAYAAAAAKALAPLTQHEDMRVRLNAAIANARIAERAGNTRLQDITVKFINDKTSAVALWGVKAARAMLPTVLGLGNNNNPLLAALVQAVQRVGFGPIVTEIYDALSLHIVTANPKPPPNVIKGAAGEMLRVFRVRVDGYAGGVPPDPAIDNDASEFLSFSLVWQQLTPPQRVEAAQAMMDLLGFAAQHGQFMEGDDRQVLMPVFKRTGAALQVIGDALKNTPVSNAAKEVTRISTGMDGTEVIAKTDALSAALQKALPGVKPSPKLPPPPAEGDAPPADAPPAKDGKAPPPNDGKAPAAQPKSAAPAAESDAAQTAGDTTAPANPEAPAQRTPAPAPPPRAPAPPPR